MRPKFGFGIGNRNQGSISVSVLEPIFFPNVYATFWCWRYNFFLNILFLLIKAWKNQPQMLFIIIHYWIFPLAALSCHYGQKLKIHIENWSETTFVLPTLWFKQSSKRFPSRIISALVWLWMILGCFEAIVHWDNVSSICMPGISSYFKWT